ncbi:hypothetical protein BZA05DRAFT_419203 [Tricharina praecox]|uniref:uncharacterized protein n=1 Tax=Tricharina praecox TaxID=43433 RepID=UPI00221E8245|nr:uncharacterized protein BZA05DRAFT_419203 [Tricharina praecox]KAI5850687.1 hypothetical protein BZA05DRAFT_419203 [Tricharina praecox]
MSSNGITNATIAQKAGIRRPNQFLCLTPVQSASYPKAPPKSPEMVPSSIPNSILEVAPMSPPLSPTDSELKPVPSYAHRKSSVSSIGGEKQRFLKMSPVFWGGIPGEDDFAIED